jgi:tetratricopeptide (TPR) repeat protein
MAMMRWKPYCRHRPAGRAQACRYKQTYVRALANLGIAYANQEMYSESSSCYLRALSLNPDAVHIWHSLRLSLTCWVRSHSHLGHSHLSHSHFGYVAHLLGALSTVS